MDKIQNPLSPELEEPKISRKEEVRRASRSGEADALGVTGPKGEEVVTPQGDEQSDQLLAELERRVAERTAALVESHQRLEAARVAALNMMEDAVEARNKVKEVNKDLERQIAERQRAEQAVRQLSERLLQLQEQERRRIARELHDSTAQKLATLAMNLSRLAGKQGDLNPEAQQLVADSLAITEQCTQELRNLSYLLHPPLLDEVGLAGVVRDYVSGFAQRSGIRVALELDPDLGRLPKEYELALFRVVQESLGNIHRHSGSPTAAIRLERVSDEVRLEVQDAGRGIPEAILRKIRAHMEDLGMGIAGMRERLEQLSGRMEIESGPHGTIIRAILPRPSQCDNATAHSPEWSVL
jgi:signal transduction histidine kinase